ncbi:MAG: hypothetical protein GY913_04635 [Proteobacteria bacterium]|nr:hypothetical protein [Pseudomonadota bacterium]MCP4916187.1 hypothetical protein [Pseudomonadota bacterium]
MLALISLCHATPLKVVVHDTRRDAIAYSSEVNGDQVNTTAEKVELASRWWVIEQGGTELSAWEFAEVTGDHELLQSLQKEQRTLRRRALKYGVLGLGVGGAGAAMTQLPIEDAETYGGIVGAVGVGIVVVGSGGGSVDEEPPSSWLDEAEANARVDAYNASL